MAEKNLEQMQEAVAEIREKMAAAAREAGRDPAAVQLCAACKTRTAQTLSLIHIWLWRQRLGQDRGGAQLGQPGGCLLYTSLIGMHLRRVAVPVRLSLSKIGEANILCARTRPKLIGGERAKYTEED